MRPKLDSASRFFKSQPTPRVVGDVMTREVIALNPYDDLLGVGEAMERLRFRHLPVVEDGVLVGLVTRGDLWRASVSSLEPGATERDRDLKHSTVAYDIMHRGVRTVSPESPLIKAARTMRDERIGCLPVVSEGNRLLGIITEADFLKLAIRLLQAEEDGVSHVTRL